MKLQPLNDVAETRVLVSNMSEPTTALDHSQDEQTGEPNEPNKPEVTIPNDPEIHQTGDTTGSGLLDEFGIEWDKSIHSSPPKKTKTGRWYKKRGPAASSSSPAGQPQNPYKLAGKAAAGLTIQLGVGIGGNEWLPVKTREYDEFASIENAYTQYFESKDIQDFPPGIALAIALGSYALPRMFQPETRTRIGRLGLWIRKRYNKIRRGRKASQSEHEG